MAWIVHKQWQCRHTLSSLTLFLLFILIVLVQEGRLEVLTPPYFNLAENRRITASATCGEDERELYCKLVGANADTADINSFSHIVIQGQVNSPYTFKLIISHSPFRSFIHSFISIVLVVDSQLDTLLPKILYFRKKQIEN